MKLFHELISEYAALHLEKTALADSRGETSYGKLEAGSAAAASRLRALGLRAGQAAAVYVPYTGDILLGAVSVLRAGGVFLPFDDAYPIERLQFMLRDADAGAVLTVRALWDGKKLDFPEEKVVFLDGLPAGTAPDMRSEGLSEDSPAMLLYTSGTTGNPKGVLHSHRMLLHLVDWMNAAGDTAMDEETRSGVMSSFSFVGTQMFLLGPPAKGGTVCVAPEAARKDLAALAAFLRREKITHIFLPSGLAAILAEDYDVSGRFIFAAGEKLRSFRPHTPGNFLINSYGSTELSGVMAKKIYGNEDEISIGKPWINTRARITDEALKPLPSGEAGELLISSNFMSRRYYRLPELSAEKWVELDGLTWFRTGDRAVCTPDGEYVLLGRIDNMVKLRGFRIETGEVETQIARAAARLGQDDVGQIAVTVRTLSGTEHLCCYYEAAKELDERVVTEEIAKSLAAYMLPDIWVRMDALPRNANGKVLRRELPQPKRKHRTCGVLDSEVVSRLVLTAAELLEPEGFIGPDDRFTDLGGTSLSAMQYAALLRQQGIKVSAAQVLQLNVLRRIAEAAEVVWEQLWTREEYDALRRDFAARGEHILRVLPLSPEQDEMLFMQLLHPDRGHFQNTWFLQLDSPVSENCLREALDTVAQENEVLRSAVVYHNVSVIQQVITDRRVPLDMVERDGFGSSEMAELRRQIETAPSDLQRDSLMRAAFIRAGEKNFLCVTAHSIAVDKQKLRACMERLIGVLEKQYPEDVSIRDWREALELGLEAGRSGAPEETKKPIPVPAGKDAPPELCVYAESDRPKLVFVHTGNTGSEAYYALADRLDGRLSFAVIEPFNLYHPDQAVYGIGNIAANYIRILKRWQPEGPYLLGGWCYGGVVAHEMACQLERAGEEVRHLFMLDSHALADARLRELSKGMLAQVDRAYFETSPLFAELRENGMLEAVVRNAAHVAEDLTHHTPSFYHGAVTYFKPDQVPAGISGDNLRYWEQMMEFEAGNYEHYCCREKLRIIHTPHEHDLMMDDPSLDIIVPAILKAT